MILSIFCVQSEIPSLLLHGKKFDFSLKNSISDVGMTVLKNFCTISKKQKAKNETYYQGGYPIKILGRVSQCRHAEK